MFDRRRIGPLKLIVALSGARSHPGFCASIEPTGRSARREANILVLAIVTRRLRIPLMWTILDRAGTSNTEERIALLRRYLERFEAISIRLLLADREFI